MGNPPIKDGVKIIKSRERVRERGEVFTSEREVTAMLNLVRYLSENVENTLLEPSCGTGNFLSAILSRKLNTVKLKHKKKDDVEFYIVKAVASIYGIDISEENIKETQQRLLDEVRAFYLSIFKTKKAEKEFWDSINWVLERNIIVGDMLNKIDDIVLVEYTTPKKYSFTRQEFKLAEPLSATRKNVTLFDSAAPLKSYKISKYQLLCS